MLHEFRVRVYYEDTDMAGIVYHANYLKFIERARSDWVRGMGIDQNALRDNEALLEIRLGYNPMVSAGGVRAGSEEHPKP